MLRESERAAMRAYLATYRELRAMESRVRWRERALVAMAAAVVSLNVIAAAEPPFDALSVLCLLIACAFALNLRRMILDGIERRRDWLVLDGCATYAHRRLVMDADARRHAA